MERRNRAETMVEHFPWNKVHETTISLNTNNFSKKKKFPSLAIFLVSFANKSYLSLFQNEKKIVQLQYGALQFFFFFFVAD